MLTVSEFATRSGVSVQAIYRRIKAGKLEYERKDGIVYVTSDSPAEPDVPDDTDSDQEIVALLREQIRTKDEQIKSLHTLIADQAKNYQEQIRTIREEMREMAVDHREQMRRKDSHQEQANILMSNMQKQMLIEDQTMKGGGFFKRLFGD